LKFFIFLPQLRGFVNDRYHPRGHLEYRFAAAGSKVSKLASKPKQIEAVKCFPAWLCKEVFLKIQKAIQDAQDTWNYIREQVGCSVNMVNRQKKTRKSGRSCRVCIKTKQMLS
jgi:hypothetical protein